MLLPAVIISILVTATVSDLSKCIGYNQDECFECCDRDKKDENIKLEKGDDLFFLAFGSTAGYDCKWLKYSADNITTPICCYTNSRPIRDVCWDVKNGLECRPEKEVIVIKDRKRKINCTLQIHNVDTNDDGIYTSSIEWGGRKHILNVVKTYDTERAQITEGEPIEFESFGTTIETDCKWTKAGVDTETRPVCCYTNSGSNLCDGFENDPECHDASEVKVIKEERHKQGECTILIQDTTESDSGEYSSSIERDKKFRLTVTPEKNISVLVLVLISILVFIFIVCTVFGVYKYIYSKLEKKYKELKEKKDREDLLLLNAIKSSNEDNNELQRLINNEKIPIGRARDEKGNSVLHLAAMDKCDIAKTNLLISICDKKMSSAQFYVHEEEVLLQSDSGEIKTMFSDKNSWGETPLHLACKHEQMTVFDYLMDKSVSVDDATDKGDTALHYAAKDGKCEIVKILLAKGANKDAKNTKGETPVFKALKGEDVSTLDVLLEKGVNVSIKTNHEELTPLHYVIQVNHSNLEDMVKRLIQRGADIKAKNSEGQTPLHTALKKNKPRPNIVHQFHKENPEVFWEIVQDTQGVTVLKMALEAGTRDVVALILKKVDVGNFNDIDILATFKNNWTLLHHAAALGMDKLVQSIVESDPEQVKSMINLKTTDEQVAKRDGYTALHKAVEVGHELIVELLIGAEGDLSIANNKGLTPLLLAIYTKKGFNLFKTLFEAQFKQSNETIDFLKIKTAKEGKTALRLAVQNGLYDIVKFLLDKGADCNEVDNTGLPLLHTALMGGHPSVWKLLILKEMDFKKKFGEDEESYLHIAVRLKNVNAVQIILGDRRDEDEDPILSQIDSRILLIEKDKYQVTAKMKAQAFLSHYETNERQNTQDYRKMYAILKAFESSEPTGKKANIMTPDEIIQRIKDIQNSDNILTLKKRREFEKMLRNPSQDQRRTTGIKQEQVSAALQLRNQEGTKNGHFELGWKKGLECDKTDNEQSSATIIGGIDTTSFLLGMEDLMST